MRQLMNRPQSEKAQPIRLRLFALMTGLLAAAACIAESGSGGQNAEQHLNSPYLIIISIDGYRRDYLEQYPTRTIRRFADQATRSEGLVPVWPTLTFPNHYSIVTGLKPSRHGLVSNTFYEPAMDRWYVIRDRSAVMDQRFYAGEPIWVTAETQGMVAAAFFFVGTEAPINGVYPTHWRSYDKDITGEDRVDFDVLAAIARRTGGEFYNAEDEAALDAVYRRIDQTAVADVRTQSWRPRESLVHWPAGIAVILVLLTYAGLLFSSRRRGKRA